MTNALRSTISKKAFQAASVAIFFLAPTAVLAAGGIEKVDSFLNNVSTWLSGVSLVVVTIAIMWVGYKWLFTERPDKTELMKILVGAIFIGGASQIGAYLLG